MMRASRSLGLLTACSLVAPGVVFGQAEQVLKDAWAATSDTIFDIDTDAGSLVGPKNPADGSRNFEAIAFEAPELGGLTGGRNLVAVDGTEILRYYNGTNEASENPSGPNPELVYDASNNPSALRFVNTVAVSTDGQILFSGYSKRKRRFELWEINPDPANPAPREVAVGTPQLTDAVFISSEDAANQPVLMGGGLLATTDREVLFIPQGNPTAFFSLVDIRDLPVRNNTQILSTAYVADTDYIIVALSTRELITIDLQTRAAIIAGIPADELPDPACADNRRSQQFRIRNVGTQDADAVNVLTDACGQVLYYAFDTLAPTTSSFTTLVAPSASLTNLAVGEGNQVLCQSGVTCTLTNGYEADSDATQDSQLLVLKVNNLCDPRVPAAASACFDASYAAINGGNLILNDILPQTLSDALDAKGVEIVIPPYMFAAAPDAVFGAVFVQADEFSRDALISARLEIGQLLTFAGLGVDIGSSRGTPVIDLLNNDVVAYAPDDPNVPTVRGFEATPSVVGEGSVAIRKRGYSVDIYGLMHDVNGPSTRVAGVGGTAMINPAGSPPQCNLVEGGRIYTAPDDQDAYFLNLTACLFRDIELLLTDGIIPAGAISASDQAALEARLGNVEDKLIKALNEALDAGPNAGSTNFQSVISQLNDFDSRLFATPFAEGRRIYKNDLIVRSEVFRFYLLERADPTIAP